MQCFTDFHFVQALHGGSILIPVNDLLNGLCNQRPQRPLKAVLAFMD